MISGNYILRNIGAVQVVVGKVVRNAQVVGVKVAHTKYIMNMIMRASPLEERNGNLATHAQAEGQLCATVAAEREVLIDQISLPTQIVLNSFLRAQAHKKGAHWTI
ncbi:MAG: hypothetical protein GTO12_05930 [Proteobacteria bacterium]|nr:hypothetical protein [Pseudomonadota bacterium]